MLSNKNNKVIYTGVTSNLHIRIYEHKESLYPRSFTSRYNVNKLVYYEGFHSIEEAIYREKQIKGGSRINKIQLIERMNPNWNDLFNKIPDGE